MYDIFKTKIFFIAIILFAVFGFTKNSWAEIIFQDNFDDHSDWSPTQAVHGNGSSSQDGNSITACTGCPDGTAKYMGYYLQSSAWPDYVGNNTMNISSLNARGGKGKALTHWTEPINASCDGNAWCSDGQLSILLPDNYDEIYVRFYIKFDPEYVFDWENSFQSFSSEKFFRTTHYHEEGSSTLYRFGYNVKDIVNDGYDHHPVEIFDLGQNQYNQDAVRLIMGPRYTSTYEPTSATPVGVYSNGVTVPGGTGYGGDKTMQELLADGEWHCFEFYHKGNTAGGYYNGTPDGIYRMWLDGTQVHELTNLAWADGADDQNDWTPEPFPGWNWVSIGGNSRNFHYAQATATSETDAQEEEQWYAIDDIVISTEYIGPEEGSDIIAPSAPGGLNIN
jgi:hypothetical protein